MAGRPVNIRRPADAIKAGIAFGTRGQEGGGPCVAIQCGTEYFDGRLEKHKPKTALWNKAEKQEMAREQIKALEIKTPL